jgi:hypothetical protein
MSIKITDFKPAEGLDEVQRMSILKIANSFSDIAAEVEYLCPDSNYKAICMSHLLTAKMFATQSVTHTGYVPKKVEVKKEEKEEKVEIQQKPDETQKMVDEIHKQTVEEDEEKDFV